MDSGKYFLSEEKFELDPQKLESVVRHALVEDIGKGDITTQLTIPKEKNIRAILLAKEDFVACGITVAEKVFKTVDNKIKFKSLIEE